MKKLTALEELSLKKEAAALIPTLIDLGLDFDNACPLAVNCAKAKFVLNHKDYPSAIDILKSFSLEEIADIADDNIEFGFNASFEENTNEPK